MWINQNRLEGRDSLWQALPAFAPFPETLLPTSILGGAAISSSCVEENCLLATVCSLCTWSAQDLCNAFQ